MTPLELGRVKLDPAGPYRSFETPAIASMLSRSRPCRIRAIGPAPKSPRGRSVCWTSTSAGAPANFSMRGFTFGAVNVLYNGISIGVASDTTRVMDTANLDQVEFLKGPSALMSGIDVDRRLGQLRQQATDHGADPERAGPVGRFARNVPLAFWFGRQHRRSRVSTIASTRPDRTSTASSTAITGT